MRPLFVKIKHSRHIARLSEGLLTFLRLLLSLVFVLLKPVCLLGFKIVLKFPKVDCQRLSMQFVKGRLFTLTSRRQAMQTYSCVIKHLGSELYWCRLSQICRDLPKLSVFYDLSVYSFGYTLYCCHFAY